MAAYACVPVTADANENVLKKIYEYLNTNYKYFNTKFSVRFVGFEAAEGTTFKINGIGNRVPSSGYFITPYGGNYYMNINSLTFDEGCSGLNIYIIY